MRPRLGGEVEIAEQLAQCEAADGSIVGGETTVLEHPGG